MIRRAWFPLAAVTFLLAACTTNVVDDPVAGTGGAGATGTTTSSAGGSGPTDYPAIEPEPGEAGEITLQIYSDGWGTLLDTITVGGEGPVVIDVEETEPYSDPPAYYIYARAAGYYTEIYACTKGNSIDVDLDAVPTRPNAVAGVIVGQQGFFADRVLASTALHLTGPGVDTTIQTDAQGRYGVEGLPLGAYALEFTYQDTLIHLSLTNATEGTDYADLLFEEPMQAS